MTNESEISTSKQEPLPDNSESQEKVTDSTTDSKTESKGGHNLLIRTISALVMVAVAGFVIFWGKCTFGAIVALISIGLVQEYCYLTKAKGYNPNFILCAICSVAMILLGSSELKIVVIGWLSMAIMVWCLFISALDNVFYHQERKSFILDSAINCFAVLYCGFLPSSLCYLRNINIFLVVFLVVICIATDVGGYFFGKAIGGPKLSPLSPGKTWAGFWGGLLCSIACIYGLLYWNVSAGIFMKYNVYFWLIMGVGCCLVGQIGDLFESSLKRDAGCKDSGTIIPGHGGVLDRFDSYLFASMFAYMWLTLCISFPALDSLFSF